ncbi:hypothetical protein PanWU01x14_344920, partial [Parasponia andersonii]
MVKMVEGGDWPRLEVKRKKGEKSKRKVTWPRFLGPLYRAPTSAPYGHREKYITVPNGRRE